MPEPFTDMEFAPCAVCGQPFGSCTDGMSLDAHRRLPLQYAPNEVLEDVWDTFLGIRFRKFHRGDKVTDADADWIEREGGKVRRPVDDKAIKPADDKDDPTRPMTAAELAEGELRTKSGRVLTEADIEALADEAERGYDVSHLKNRGRVITATEAQAEEHASHDVRIGDDGTIFNPTCPFCWPQGPPEE